MTDEEINAIIAQAANDNPSVRMASTVVTSEETVADVQAAFLEALGDSANSAISTDTATDSQYIEQWADGTDSAEEAIEEEEEEIVDYASTLESEEVVTTVKTEDTVNNMLPVNSQSNHVNEMTSRFSDAIWYNKIQEKVIILAGLGGIGSYIAFLLARMKPKALYLYDDDTVEAANMSGQLYGKTDIGRKKVNAMSIMVNNYADFGSVFCLEEKFTALSEASDIMICGFDNMSARHTFFHKWIDHVCKKSEQDQKKCLFIDGRLAAESLQVFCITGDDEYNQEKYSKKWLFMDSQADATVCSYKQTTFCANMIGSIITNLFVNFCANECNPLVPRDLPFMTSYEADTMYFKTVN